MLMVYLIVNSFQPYRDDFLASMNTLAEDKVFAQGQNTVPPDTVRLGPATRRTFI